MFGINRSASSDDMQDYLTETAKLCAETPQDDPRYEEYHRNMNDVIDQMWPEGRS